MYMSFIVSIMSNITNLDGFQQLLLLPQLIENTFFLYQQNKSSEFKVKFRQATSRCKRVCEAAKLEYATKTKESITSQKPVCWDYWRIANSVLSKSNSAIPPLFNRPEMLSAASYKAKLFAKNFSQNSNLDDSGIFTCFPFQN